MIVAGPAAFRAALPNGGRLAGLDVQTLPLVDEGVRWGAPVARPGRSAPERGTQARRPMLPLVVIAIPVAARHSATTTVWSVVAAMRRD